MRPSGIVTLTTDYGSRDPFVGIVTGRILARCPGAQVVSLTHEVTPYEPDEAGFWLSRSWHEFPTGTVHVAVVDPGVGTSRDILAMEAGGHCFLAPDNGLLDRVRHQVRVEHSHRLGEAELAALGIHARSRTFHGRDIFAPVAGELAAGRITIADLGPASLLPALAPAARAPGEGRIVAIDHFGNLISDLELESAELSPDYGVEIAGRRIPCGRTYGDVPRGEPVALVNSLGLVEVAVNTGHAAAVLGVARGEPLRLVPGRS